MTLSKLCGSGQIRVSLQPLIRCYNEENCSEQAYESKCTSSGISPKYIHNSSIECWLLLRFKIVLVHSPFNKYTPVDHKTRQIVIGQEMNRYECQNLRTVVQMEWDCKWPYICPPVVVFTWVFLDVLIVVINTSQTEGFLLKDLTEDEIAILPFFIYPWNLILHDIEPDLT